MDATLHAACRAGKAVEMTQTFRLPDLTGIQVRPARLWTQSLSWILFVAGIALYAHFSIVRHRENPEDRVIPSATQLVQGLKASVLEPAEEDDPLDPRRLIGSAGPPQHDLEGHGVECAPLLHRACCC